MTSAAHRPPRPKRAIAAIVAICLAAGTIGFGAGFVVADHSTASSSTTKTPDVVDLAGRLANQKLSWDECEFDDPINELNGVDVSNVECATIEVPQDWHSPDPTKTWHLRISQAKNIDPADEQYTSTLLIHRGGPVDPGLQGAAIVQHGTPELRPTTNFVSFDQRGIGQSSIIDCTYEFDPASDASESEMIADACSDDPAVRTLTSEQTSYDMDFIRHLLGLRTVSYLGYSYGTWLGAWFGSLFADHIDRLVLDSALDVTQRSIQDNMTRQYAGYDRQFRLHLLDYIARHDAEYGLGSDPEVIWNRYNAAIGTPVQARAAGLLWIHTGLLAAFSKNVGYPYAAPLVQQIIAVGESAPQQDDLVERPAAAAVRMLDRFEPAAIDATMLANARAQLTEIAGVATPDEPETRTFDSTVDFIYCNDGEWAQGADYWNAVNAETAVRSPFTTSLGRLDEPPLCAWWPSKLVMPHAGVEFPDTIVVQSELDALTPLESGRSSGTRLPNASLIVVDNEARHGVFPYGSDAVDEPVIRFLLGGKRPADITIADALPLPFEDSVFDSWGPLNPDAEHDDPGFTVPDRPAVQRSETSSRLER